MSQGVETFLINSNLISEQCLSVSPSLSVSFSLCRTMGGHCQEQEVMDKIPSAEEKVKKEPCSLSEIRERCKKWGAEKFCRNPHQIRLQGFKY